VGAIGGLFQRSALTRGHRHSAVLTASLPFMLCSNTRARTRKDTRNHAHTHARTHTHTHARAHARCTRTCTHTRACAHTHTRTHAGSRGLRGRRLGLARRSLQADRGQSLPSPGADVGGGEPRRCGDVRRDGPLKSWQRCGLGEPITDVGRASPSLMKLRAWGLGADVGPSACVQVETGQSAARMLRVSRVSTQSTLCECSEYPV
jgi:hypothetical protein